MPLAEEALVAWLRQRTGGSASPIGDDAALLALQGDFAITIDSQEAGVHFPPHLPAKVIARRALAVNLSDLAACGAEPRLAFLALAAPAGFPHRRFLDAFTQACRDAGVELAGGDLSRSDRVRATVCLIGKRQRSGRWPRRSLGRAGDVVWIGGTLGESAAGCRTLERGARWSDDRVQLPAHWRLEPQIARAARASIRRHLFPRAQLELGRWLARRPRAAAIDVSDGLAKDLRRLTAASGVGARLDLDRIPIPAHLGALARFLECEANDLVLGGGEDYVLLFALPAGQAPPPRFDCRAIGELTRSRALRIRRGGRDWEPLPPLGFDHLQR